MPCRSDYMAPTPGEQAAAIRREYKAELDRLTAENDLLRDTVLGLINDPKYKVPAAVKKKIESAQVKHRKEDLARLEEVFYDKKDSERLAKVWAADPKKPLEEQLGFNPDDF